MVTMIEINEKSVFFEAQKPLEGMVFCWHTYTRCDKDLARTKIEVQNVHRKPVSDADLRLFIAVGSVRDSMSPEDWGKMSTHALLSKIDDSLSQVRSEYILSRSKNETPSDSKHP